MTKLRVVRPVDVVVRPAGGRADRAGAVLEEHADERHGGPHRVLPSVVKLLKTIYSYFHTMLILTQGARQTKNPPLRGAFYCYFGE